MIRAPVAAARAPAGLDRRPGDLAEHGGRRAFDHHIGRFGERAQRHDRHRSRESSEAPPGPRDVACADRDEAEARQTAVEPAGEGQADRAQAAERHAKLAAALHRRPPRRCAARMMS
jgi:hypothetical protein